MCEGNQIFSYTCESLFDLSELALIEDLNPLEGEFSADLVGIIWFNNEEFD